VSDEVRAGLRILVAISRADGQFHEAEATAVKNAILAAKLDAGGPVVAVDIDVDEEIATIRSADARQCTYDAACALAYLDGEASPDELALLEKLRSAFGLPDGHRMVDRFIRAYEADAPALPPSVAANDERRALAQSTILRAAVRASIFGRFPTPFVGETLVAKSDLRMLETLGALFGEKRDRARWTAFAEKLSGRAAARIASFSLIKLIPGWGSIAAGEESFVTTWALGRTALGVLDGAVKEDAVQAAFEAARAEGRAAAETSRSEIEAATKQFDEAQTALAFDLATGKVSEAEYAARFVALE
jgi:uncharacterized protein (DUF697 family)